MHWRGRGCNYRDVFSYETNTLMYACHSIGLLQFLLHDAGVWCNNLGSVVAVTQVCLVRCVCVYANGCVSVTDTLESLPPHRASA